MHMRKSENGWEGNVVSSVVHMRISGLITDLLPKTYWPSDDRMTEESIRKH